VRSIIHCGDGELRGGGKGYCALPPSIHPNGIAYRWLIELTVDAPPVIDDLEAAGLIPAPVTQDYSGWTQDNSGNRELCINSVDEAIRATIPKAPGQRNHAIFEFCRWIKAAMPDAKPAQLRPLVQQWHKAALPYMATEPFEETWGVFLYGLDRVRFPWGCGVLAKVQSRLAVTDPPAEAQMYEQPELRRLIVVCQLLQREHGDAPFFVAVRRAAELVGLDPERHRMKVWRWLTVILPADGWLEVAQRGTRKDATTFRYIGPPKPQPPDESPPSASDGLDKTR